MKKFFKKHLEIFALIFLPAITLIVIVIFAWDPYIRAAIHPVVKPEWVFYRVVKGDSIFSIAQSVCDPEDRRDPRGIVEEIQNKNKIEGETIYPDQVIKIPLFTTPEAKRSELREFTEEIQKNPGQI